MYTISKQFTFSASHQLKGLPEGHPCARLHGHNYRVEVVLSASTLNEVGFVKDYGELKPFQQWLDAQYDHRHLNDQCEFNPTAENLAKQLFNVARDLLGPTVRAVRVSETDKTWATYEPLF
jgi:6-pyruvoyltetrahydropterin/6-carboxytetrahydropterin synthase